MAGPRHVRQILLPTLIVGLAVTGLVGIYVLLLGRFSKTDEKILMTTLAISYFSLTSLACAAAYEKQLAALLSFPGLALGIAGFVLFIPTIWIEWHSHMLEKSMAILAIFSFSFAQACLLSLLPLRRRLCWIYYTAAGFILALAAFAAAAIVWEFHGDWVVRMAGTIGILDGFFSLAVPLFYKLGGKPPQGNATGRCEQIDLRCPRCGERGNYPLGTIECRHCALRMSVNIE